MITKEQEEVHHKFKVFEHTNNSGSVLFTCQYYFCISRDVFYRWEKNYKNKDKKSN